MGIFEAAHGCGGQKGPSRICNTPYNDETCHIYTLPKEDPKIYESRDTSPDFC